MEAITYRGYTIEPSSWPGFNFDYYPTDYDGQPVRTARSIKEAKEEIDIKIFENTVWKVKVPHCEPVKFNWLSEAVDFCNKCNGILIDEFNAM